MVFVLRLAAVQFDHPFLALWKVLSRFQCHAYETPGEWHWIAECSFADRGMESVLGDIWCCLFRTLSNLLLQAHYSIANPSKASFRFMIGPFYPLNRAVSLTGGVFSVSLAFGT